MIIYESIDYKGYSIIFPMSNGNGVEVYKSGKFIQAFDTEDDAKEWIDSKVRKTESCCIVGFKPDGTKKFYNADDGDWHDSVEEVTVYDDHDDALEKWFEITKNGNAKYVKNILGFKNVFIPTYDKDVLKNK